MSRRLDKEIEIKIYKNFISLFLVFALLIKAFGAVFINPTKTEAEEK